MLKNVVDLLKSKVNNPHEAFARTFLPSLTSTFNLKDIFKKENHMTKNELLNAVKKNEQKILDQSKLIDELTTEYSVKIKEANAELQRLEGVLDNVESVNRTLSNRLAASDTKVTQLTATLKSFVNLI